MFAEIIKKRDNTLSYRSLAGASSDGLPIGTIISLYTNSVPSGYLPCNGVEFDTTQYPALYILLGRNTTPDLRECNLVGIGQSTREAVINHDVYTLGQFKDDQFQEHTHRYSVNEPTIDNKSDTADAAPSTFEFVRTLVGTSDVTYDTTGRTGATTHGKNVGVNYAIKATTGLIDVSDAEIYDQVVAYLQANYIEKDVDADWANSEHNLIQYDAVNNKWLPVSRPTNDNQVLVSDFDKSEAYNWNNTWLDSDLETTEAVTPTETPYSLGLMCNKNGDYYTYEDVSKEGLRLGDYLLRINGEAISIPSSFNLSDTITPYYDDWGSSYTYYYYNSHLYCDDGMYVHELKFFISDDNAYRDETRHVDDPAEILEIQTNGIVIDISNIAYGTAVIWNSKEITALNSTGFTTVDSQEDIYSETFYDVYYNLQVNPDLNYKWTTNSGSKSAAFVGTRAEYEIAKNIPAGQDGYIPSNSIIVITDEDEILIGEDA